MQQGGAQDQLQGQIASAKNSFVSNDFQLYWVMTEMTSWTSIIRMNLNSLWKTTIDKIIYCLGLYNSRIIKLINKKGKLKVR
jgi:hypothetical protein